MFASAPTRRTRPTHEVAAKSEHPRRVAAARGRRASCKGRRTVDPQGGTLLIQLHWRYGALRVTTLHCGEPRSIEPALTHANDPLRSVRVQWRRGSACQRRIRHTATTSVGRRRPSSRSSALAERSRNIAALRFPTLKRIVAETHVLFNFRR